MFSISSRKNSGVTPRTGRQNFPAANQVAVFSSPHSAQDSLLEFQNAPLENMRGSAINLEKLAALVVTGNAPGE